MLKGALIGKEVHLPKDKKRKIDVEMNHGEELAPLKDIQKLHKKCKIDKATRLENVMVNEENDDTLNINSLPDEVILEIFRYLKQNELGQIARVCGRWNELIKSPVLWKNVNMQFSPYHKSPTTVIKSFISRLPTCVTSIRLEFAHTHGRLNFAELCVRLKESCPHLEVLIFTRSAFPRSFASVIDTCVHILQDVKKLVFRYCMFGDCGSAGECGGISKMEILGAFNCDAGYYGSLDKPPFPKMPYLQEIHLYGSYTCESWFEGDTSFLDQLRVLNLGSTCVTSEIFSEIQNHGRNIKELCLSLSELQDPDLNVNNSIFPGLRTICLKDSEDVTCEGVVSLLQSCESLQNVFVDEDVARSFEAHHFNVARKCKSGIVKDIVCNHSAEV